MLNIKNGHPAFRKMDKKAGCPTGFGVGGKAKMQTSEMFAFWRGGATEQIRDGSLNKKAVANQCSP